MTIGISLDITMLGSVAAGTPTSQNIVLGDPDAGITLGDTDANIVVGDTP